MDPIQKAIAEHLKLINTDWDYQDIIDAFNAGVEFQKTQENETIKNIRDGIRGVVYKLEHL